MFQHDGDTIADFIRAKGVTRCPTACAAPTHAAITASDRSDLRTRAEQHEAALEAARKEQMRRAWLRRVGAKAA